MGLHATHERIISALTELILEGGLPDFSVQEVADRAGVSSRTVYRYFPTREALLVGLLTHVDEQLRALGAVDLPGGLDELADRATRKFAAFDRIQPEMEAGVRFAVGARTDVERRRLRTQETRARVAEAVTGDDEQLELVSALVRLLTGSRAWLALRDDSGLDGHRAGVATRWAIQTLLEAMIDGRGPPPAGPAASDAPPTPRLLRDG